MKTNFDIFQTIADQPTGIKKVDKLAASLAKNFKPTQAGSLEKANDLAFWLFIHGKNELARRVCESLGSIPFDDNYNLWTWVELALALDAKLASKSEAKQRVDAIRAPLALGDEMHRTIKARALSRRLDGDLLQFEAIAEAQQDNDKKSELDYRFAHLKELVYIEVLGGSDEQSVDNVQRAIQDNIEILAKG